MSPHSRRLKGKSLKRKTATKSVLKTFRIYAEGTSTEPEYIDALKRLPQFSEALSIVFSIERAGAVPMTLVDAACEDKRSSKLDVDFYWCVFDVESPQNHPNLASSLDKARANGINLAISNPCFELWLVLHLQEHSAHLSTDDAVRLRGQLDGSASKHLSADLYMETRGDAIRRAKALRRRHTLDDTIFPNDNPSSSFDELISQFENEIKVANGKPSN
jgi:hypothetical protein